MTTFFCSFADIAESDERCLTTDGTEPAPWKIDGDRNAIDCDEEFTLILKSDESDIVMPHLNVSSPTSANSRKWLI